MGVAHTGPRPVRIYLPDADLQTTRVRGVGFRVKLADGRYTPTRKTYREARQDAKDHRDNQP